MPCLLVPTTYATTAVIGIVVSGYLMSKLVELLAGPSSLQMNQTALRFPLNPAQKLSPAVPADSKREEIKLAPSEEKVQHSPKKTVSFSYQASKIRIFNGNEETSAPFKHPTQKQLADFELRWASTIN